MPPAFHATTVGQQCGDSKVQDRCHQDTNSDTMQEPTLPATAEKKPVKKLHDKSKDAQDCQPAAPAELELQQEALNTQHAVQPGTSQGVIESCATAPEARIANFVRTACGMKDIGMQPKQTRTLLLSRDMDPSTGWQLASDNTIRATL